MLNRTAWMLESSGSSKNLEEDFLSSSMANSSTLRVGISAVELGDGMVSSSAWSAQLLVAGGEVLEDSAMIRIRSSGGWDWKW